MGRNIDKVPAFKKIPKSKITVKKITRGLANYVYLVSYPENKGIKKFILRIPKKATFALKRLLKTDPYSEYVNSNRAYSLGFGAKMDFFDANSGVSMVRYVENKKTLSADDFQDIETLKQGVLLLKRLHFSKVKFDNDVDMILNLERLANFLMRHSSNCIPEDLYTSLSVVQKVKEIFKRLDITMVPCHNDTSPSNFLLTRNGMVLIDWEYSGNNDPAWDLAFLSVVTNFNYRYDTLMVSMYGNKKDKTLFERVIIYKVLIKLWLFFVNVFYIEYSNDLEDKRMFHKFASLRYYGYKQAIQSKEFKDSLNRLESCKR